MNRLREDFPTLVRPLLPAVLAALYPFVLDVFHHLAGPPGQVIGFPAGIIAAGVLILAFAVPAIGMLAAARWARTTSQRHIAYACVMAPTLYVFLGVIQYMLKSPVPDKAIWCVFWALAAIRTMGHQAAAGTVKAVPGSWRVAHGVAGAIVLVFVVFHLGNHLAGLWGGHAHAAIMAAGRKVYRAVWVEPLLVAAMLFQIGSGLLMAWRWSAVRPDWRRVFQVASGFYLSMFILGHMNSVFIFARASLHIPTNWAFATGAPTGLLHDPWNIRLVPHYALGVFFVLTHLVSGLRIVLMAHGMEQKNADRLWSAGAALGAVIAAAILAGMCGVRVAAS